jgi:hypothetical protein
MSVRKIMDGKGLVHNNVRKYVRLPPEPRSSYFDR